MMIFKRQSAVQIFVHDVQKEVAGCHAKIERPEEGSPVISIGEDFKIRVNAIWRLIARDGLVATLDDDGQWFGLSAPFEAYQAANDRLSGAKVKTVEFDHLTGDLRLRFTGDLTLEVVSTSAGYENWVMDLKGKFFAASAAWSKC